MDVSEKNLKHRQHIQNTLARVVTHQCRHQHIQKAEGAPLAANQVANGIQGFDCDKQETDDSMIQNYVQSPMTIGAGMV